MWHSTRARRSRLATGTIACFVAMEVAVAALAGVNGPPPTPTGYTHVWGNATTDGMWDTVANWIGPGVPETASASVYFYGDETDPLLNRGAAELDINVTLGKLKLENGAAVRIITDGDLAFGYSDLPDAMSPELLGRGSVFNHGTLRILQGIELTSSFSGSFINDGIFSIDPPADPNDVQRNARFNVNADFTLAGRGQMVLHGGNVLDVVNDSTLTQGSEHTIRGFGSLYGTIVNEGRIVADEDGETLTIDPKGKPPGFPTVGNGDATFTNAGTLRATNGGVLSYVGRTETFAQTSRVEAIGGTIHFDEGFTQLNNAMTTVAEGGMLTAAGMTLSGGRLSGDGVIAGNGSTRENLVDVTVENRAATVAPSGMTIHGHYAQSEGAMFAVPVIDVASDVPLVRVGTADISGGVSLSLPASFVESPHLPDFFESGVETTLTLLETAAETGTGRFTIPPPDGLTFDYGISIKGIRYLKENGDEVEGEGPFKRVVLDLESTEDLADFDQDGDVDGDDFLIWQSNFGTSQGASHEEGDADYDGDTDGDDFLVWQVQFGSSSGAGGESRSGGIPEPASVLLMMASTAACLGRRDIHAIGRSTDTQPAVARP